MLRQFTDPHGNLWQVWDVKSTQSLVERRSTRRRHIIPLDYPGPERRTLRDRRRAAQGSAHAQTVGWLAFESRVGKRRLMGIPPTWKDATDAQLMEWWGRAQPVETTLEWGAGGQL